MRTTIEMPDELLHRAKSTAALRGISLRQFFLVAVQHELTQEKRKVRKPAPTIGEAGDPVIKALTREQIDEAIFG
jgi:hypothetical protein